MTAVSHCAYALNHATEELRGDQEVVKVALREVARLYGSAVMALDVQARQSEIRSLDFFFACFRQRL